MISLKLPVKVIPSPRPKVTRFGTYMPKNYVDQKKYIQAKISRFESLGNVPLRCEVVFGFKPSKNALNNKYQMPRGDIDNYVKSVLDACNGILFDDDTQIVELEAKKIYYEFDFVSVNFIELSKYDIILKSIKGIIHGIRGKTKENVRSLGS